MNPRGPSRASKSQKTAFSKKWFSRWTFTIFSLLGPPKRESRGPRRLPKDTQRTPRPQKRDPKLDPKIIKNWTNFGATLGKKRQAKKNQKWIHFWGTLPPHLRGPNNAPPNEMREGCKNCLFWNYTLQKKGRDKAL